MDAHGRLAEYASDARGVNVAKAGLTALERAGVTYCVYNNPEWIDDLPIDEELDVLVRRNDVSTAERALRGAGFYWLFAPAHPNHRFYVTIDAGRWIMLDLKANLASGPDTAHIEGVLARRRQYGGFWAASDEDLERRLRRQQSPPQRLYLRHRISRAIAYRRPLSVRRLGPVVALLGPDGAGKGTVLEELARRIPAALRVIYLGGFAPSKKDLRRATMQSRDSNAVDDSGTEAASRFWGLGGPLKSLVRNYTPWTVREAVFLTRRAAMLWGRLLSGYAAAWRGQIVLCDRYPSEVTVIDTERTPLGGLLERTLLARSMPRPDAVILLDASGEAMFARKGELTPQVLEAQRMRYHEVYGASTATTVVETSGQVSESVGHASEAVWRALSRRRQW